MIRFVKLAFNCLFRVLVSRFQPAEGGRDEVEMNRAPAPQRNRGGPGSFRNGGFGGDQVWWKLNIRTSMAMVFVVQCVSACMHIETLSGNHAQCFSNHLGEAKCEIDQVLLMSVPPLGKNACFLSKITCEDRLETLRY